MAFPSSHGAPCTQARQAWQAKKAARHQALARVQALEKGFGVPPLQRSAKWLFLADPTKSHCFHRKKGSEHYYRSWKTCFPLPSLCGKNLSSPSFLSALPRTAPEQEKTRCKLEQAHDVPAAKKKTHFMILSLGNIMSARIAGNPMLPSLPRFEIQISSFDLAWFSEERSFSIHKNMSRFLGNSRQS